MTRWRYDVDPRDPLVQVRIPVTGICPVFPYLVTFHKESLHRPTDREVLLISSFGLMLKAGFSGAEQADMDTEVFDFHPRATTFVFHKYLRDDWGFRRSTWHTGSAFTPPSPRVATRLLGPLALVKVMDMIWTDRFDGVDERWTAWKQEHPEVFS